jgi:hypothetical protein
MFADQSRGLPDDRPETGHDGSLHHERDRQPMRSVSRERPRRGTEGAANHGLDSNRSKPACHPPAPIETRLDPQTEAAPSESPDGARALGRTLEDLAAILPRLADALKRQADDRPRVERLTYRIEDLADALGVSRRFFERARVAGRLPKPDLRIGKVPLWRVETIRTWLDKGGRL